MIADLLGIFMRTRIQIAAAILSVLSIPVCTADDFDVDLNVALGTVRTKLFMFAIDEWGSRERTTQLLSGCGNSGSVSKLWVSPVVKREKLSSHLLAIRNEDPELDKQLSKLTPRETSSLIQSVVFTLAFYGHGYVEGFEAVVDKLSDFDFCKVKLLMADQFLGDEKADK